MAIYVLFWADGYWFDSRHFGRAQNISLTVWIGGMISINDVDEGDDDDFREMTPVVSTRFRSNLLEGQVVVPGSSLESLSAIREEGESVGHQITPKSQEMEQKYLFSLETIRQLRHRLVRRTGVIEEIRKYYLRDIVTMKHVLKDVLVDSEREAAWKRYEEALPSLDLKESLMLHAPAKCEFRVKPCEMCGGQLELVTKDTDEVDYLKKIIKEGKDRENRWREKLAYLDVQVETANREKAETTKSHMEEVPFRIGCCSITLFDYFFVVVQ
jgi:hypothetical protein